VTVSTRPIIFSVPSKTRVCDRERVEVSKHLNILTVACRGLAYAVTTDGAKGKDCRHVLFWSKGSIKFVKVLDPSNCSNSSICNFGNGGFCWFPWFYSSKTCLYCLTCT